MNIVRFSSELYTDDAEQFSAGFFQKKTNTYLDDELSASLGTSQFHSFQSDL